MTELRLLVYGLLREGHSLSNLMAGAERLGVCRVPGFDLFGVHVPLNLDRYTDITIASWNGDVADAVAGIFTAGAGDGTDGDFKPVFSTTLNGNTKVGGVYEFGFRHDPEDPLGTMADYCGGCYTNLNLPSRVDMLAHYVKEYEADGFLINSIKSCNSFSAGQLLMLREVEKRIKTTKPKLKLDERDAGGLLGGEKTEE